MMEYHQPVLLNESVDGLNIKPDGVYVDVTFGGGGHSREILKRLDKGRLLGFDQDQDAVENVPDDDRFIFARHNFRFLKNFLRYHNLSSIDGLIADLGVSSHHFDTPHRGFSFRFDTKLDMRMNTQASFTAETLINTYSVNELTRVFREYGELKNSRAIAFAIEKTRTQSAISTVQELIDALGKCIPKHKENQYLAKVFQALRIEVNKEMEMLRELILQAVSMLKKGGRLVIISYHSLEDRLVKNYFRDGNFEGERKTDMYGNVERPLEPVNRKLIVPSPQEIEINNRARSARLRIAEKIV